MDRMREEIAAVAGVTVLAAVLAALSAHRVKLKLLYRGRGTVIVPVIPTFRTFGFELLPLELPGSCAPCAGLRCMSDTLMLVLPRARSSVGGALLATAGGVRQAAARPSGQRRVVAARLGQRPELGPRQLEGGLRVARQQHLDAHDGAVWRDRQQRLHRDGAPHVWPNPKPRPDPDHDPPPDLTVRQNLPLAAAWHRPHAVCSASTPTVPCNCSVLQTDSRQLPHADIGRRPAHGSRV